MESDGFDAARLALALSPIDCVKEKSFPALLMEWQKIEENVSVGGEKNPAQGHVSANVRFWVLIGQKGTSLT